MLRTLYLWIRFAADFKNANGLKKFAERCLNWLINKTTKTSMSYHQKNEKFRVEKENLLKRLSEIIQKPVLDNDEYFTIRKKVLTQNFIFYAIIIAEGFLNYISTLIFIPGEGLSFTLLRWFIAIVLTGSGIIAAEKFIESLFPVEAYKSEKIKKRSIPIAILWGILLFLVEIAIIGVSEARARDIEGGTDSIVLYYGFIILSMVLPVIAGATRWDLMHYLDAYKNTILKNHIERRLVIIDSNLRRNEERDCLYYKLQSTKYWDIYNDFRVRKENYNIKKGIDEDLTGNFAQTHDTFQKEADNRYEADIRNRINTRLLKLEKEDIGIGNKLGQNAFQEGD